MSKLSRQINEENRIPDRWILRILDNHWGIDNGIGLDQMIAELHYANGINMGERRLRDHISRLRKEKWPICSKSGHGYWMDEELGVREFTARETARAKNILYSNSSMIKGAETVFNEYQERF